MSFGYIKRVKNDEIDYKNVIFDKWDSIGKCFYFVENLQYFRIHLKDFSGYINIIIPKLRKSYRNYLHNIRVDSYELREECNFLLYFEGEGSFKLEKIKPENNCIEIDSLFLEMGYKQFIISQDLLHLKNKIRSAYGLDYYQNEVDGTLMFGIYNNIDLQMLESIKGRVGILWGGSDIMRKSRLWERILEIIINRDYENYAMSNYIWDKLESLKVMNKKLVCVSFCWNNINYLRRKNRRRDHIFIYDGIGQSKKKNDIYGINMINKFCEGRNNVIRTSKKFIEDMLDVYRKCYVSLRLTEYDGNANTAQECGMLGIPVISNQDMNHCISWKTLEEVEWKVDYIRKKGVNIYWKKDGINLVFISNDDVGKGGGATFTYRLVKYLEKRGFNVWVLYMIDSKKLGEEIDGRVMKVRLDMRKRWDIKERLERFVGMDVMNNCKIILRSYIPVREINDLVEYDVLFFVPGLYKNSLNGDYRFMGEEVKHLNKANLLIAERIESYSNSGLTRSLYQRYGFGEMGLLEINLLQMQEEVRVDGKRDIDVLMVVSDVERQIKNVNLFLELGKKIKKKFCLISGEKVKKKQKGIEYVEGLTEQGVEIYYRRSKILLNCSFFDSMSNTVLEGIKYGCSVIISRNNGLSGYIDKKCIVDGYDWEEWRRKIENVLENYDKMGKNELVKELRKKSWEVEIRLMEILSKTRYG